LAGLVELNGTEGLGNMSGMPRHYAAISQTNSNVNSNVNSDLKSKARSEKSCSPGLGWWGRWLVLLIGCGWLLPAGESRAVERPNVLFLAIDDLRNDLGALGVEHARTPHLDRLAASGRLFTRHYVQVPTCGASRAALLSGRYPRTAVQQSNNAILATHGRWPAPSWPELFREHGYRTLALGKISHYPGGLAGRDWAEEPQELPGAWDRAWIPDGPWQTPQAIMHGYANGVARRSGKSPPWEAFDGPDEAYPDAWVAAEAVKTLQELSQGSQPWMFAVGFFKPHLPFAAPRRWFDLHAAGVPDLPSAAAARPAWPSGWHGSGEFRGNYGHEAGRDPETDVATARQLRQAYAASVSYMDAQVGRVLDALHELQRERDTIVVLWSDHGFLLGEHGIWGKHCLYEAALRSPLIIRTPEMPQPGVAAGAVVETIDLYPTLADLCGLPLPAQLDGQSLRPQLDDPAQSRSQPARSFWGGNERSVRTERWRLTAKMAGDQQLERLELFDYETDPDELRNHVTEQPGVVMQLQRLLIEEFSEQR
jgi:iduronate 2-sulfatase